MKSIHGHGFIVHQFWAFILKYFWIINICILSYDIIEFSSFRVQVKEPAYIIRV